MKREEIKYMSVNDLIPYVNNARINDSAVDAVASSIKNFGFKVPIVIDVNNEIIAGHTRLKAAKKLNIDEIPCIIASDLSEAQAKAFRLADNKVSELAQWDLDLLSVEMEDLVGVTEIDMESFGFDVSKLIEHSEESIAEVVEDDYSEDVSEIKIKNGEIWKLGEHYLMCGDSTSEIDIDKLSKWGGTVDLIVTDPPYNVAYEGKTKDALKIKNDEMSDDNFKTFLFLAYKNMFNMAKSGAAIYVFHADTEGINFRQELINAGFMLKQCCIWVKNSMILGRQDYHWQHEPVLYGWKPGASHKWYSDRSQKTTWFFDKPTKNIEHPTMKPLELVAYPIKNSSKEGDTVLDLFGGSGSTLIACEQLGRKCLMMELDEKYATVIINRWEQLTGNIASKVE